MTEPLVPKPAASEDKPRYEPPQIVNLSSMGQAQGGTLGESCHNGSAFQGLCQNGRAPRGGCGVGGAPTTGQE